MIGIIDNRNIFEFHSIDELSGPFEIYASHYDCNIIVFTNSADKVKCIIADGGFKFMTTDADLIDGQEYDVRFIDSGRFRYNELGLPTEKNEKLPDNFLKNQPHKFKYIYARTPVEIGS